jgi:hypothetical protein
MVLGINVKKEANILEEKENLKRTLGKLKEEADDATSSTWK